MGWRGLERNLEDRVDRTPLAPSPANLAKLYGEYELVRLIDLIPSLAFRPR